MNQGFKMGAGSGVAAGYLLGRTRKMKFAIGLGTWLLGKRIKLDPKELLNEGVKQLGRNREVSKLTEEVRTQLLIAGKSAATAAVTHRIDGLTDQLHSRAGELREQVGGSAGAAIGAATAAGGGLAAGAEGEAATAKQSLDEGGGQVGKMTDTLTGANRDRVGAAEVREGGSAETGTPETESGEGKAGESRVAEQNGPKEHRDRDAGPDDMPHPAEVRTGGSDRRPTQPPQTERQPTRRPPAEAPAAGREPPRSRPRPNPAPQRDGGRPRRPAPAGRGPSAGQKPPSGPTGPSSDGGRDK